MSEPNAQEQRRANGNRRRPPAGELSYPSTADVLVRDCQPQRECVPGSQVGDGMLDRRRRSKPEWGLETVHSVLGKRTFSAWREEALSRAAELLTLLQWQQRKCSPDLAASRRALATAVRQHLEAATEGAHGRSWWWASLNGAAVERTYANLNHAEANLYRLSELDFLWSNLPNILTHATINLPGDDLRRRRLQLIYDRCYQQPGSIRECERSAIVAAYQGANEAARKEQLRVRGFRNVILATAVIAALLAAGVIALTAFNDTKSWLPLCFAPPNKVVCATTEATRIPEESVTEAVKRTVGAWDTAVIEFVGLLGATISATAALRNMRASADPYSLSVAVAVLKLPTGALTAFLGLLLIRAGFVPGLSDLDSSAQIIAWAIVLGSAQQLFTRFVDAQASTVLGRAAASLGELYPHQQTPSTARIPVYESRQVDITDGRPTPPFTPEAPALQKRRRRKPPA